MMSAAFSPNGPRPLPPQVGFPDKSSDVSAPVRGTADLCLHCILLWSNTCCDMISTH
jgi:hypothetical protein